MAELEQKWQSEVDDAVQGKLENDTPFFYDYHFNEVSARQIRHWGIAKCGQCRGPYRARAKINVPYPEMCPFFNWVK